MADRSSCFVPGAVDYDGRMAAHYEAGRGLSPEAAEAWRVALARHVAPAAGLTILDLGSGTGRFTRLLARWFDARVVGVEPAQGMRAAAREAGRDARIRYVGGMAEALPLRDRAFDVAWLCNVIHHVRDRRAAARDVRRVLRGGGLLLVAGAFAGRLDGITLFRYFPEAERVAAQFPSIEETAAWFGAAGFAWRGVERVWQQTAPDLASLAARTRLRADTTLTLIGGRAFARGQAALERAAAGQAPAPVVDGLDLLAFQAV